MAFDDLDATGLLLAYQNLLYLLIFAIWSEVKILITGPISAFFMSHIIVTTHQKEYKPLLRWLSSNHRSIISCSTTPSSTHGALKRKYRVVDVIEEKEEDQDNDKSAPTEYIPAPGRHYLWHNKTIFFIRITTETSYSENNRPQTNGTMEISAFWFSAPSIKTLIEEAKAEDCATGYETTAVYRSGYGAWEMTKSIPKREMSTVVLDGSKKEEVIQDIEEFRRPESWRQYRKLGIPYRRGYLFHGPPGTGKTSFAQALAGLFGAHLCILPLDRFSGSEHSLEDIMIAVPPRAFVLIEDVDSIGISRKKGNTNTGGEKGIALGFVLNLLDGVTSPENYILLMTTNHPENLDPALIRAGRIDKKIEFPNTTKNQARGLFMRNYEDRSLSTPLTPQEGGKCSYDSSSLSRLAEEFSKHVTENKVSPVDIQNYLLERKDDPLRAVNDAHEQPWFEQASPISPQQNSIEDGSWALKQLLFRSTSGIGVALNEVGGVL